MSCDFTEKVSLLIDEELAPEESAQVENHLATCEACQQARADFLILRQQIAAYEFAPDLIAQRQALRNILAAGQASSLTGAQPKVERQTKTGATRHWANWREQVASWLSAPRLRPALISALALMMIGIGIGVMRYSSSVDGGRTVEIVSRSPITNDHRVDVQPSSTSGQSASTTGTKSGRTETGGSYRLEQDDRNNALAKEDRRIVGISRGKASAKVVGERTERAGGGLRPKSTGHQAALGQPLPEIETTLIAGNDTISDVIVHMRELPRDADTRTVQHMEQAQLLLRPFGNDALFIKSAFILAYESRR